MFATVEIYEGENTFKEKIKALFFQPKIFSEKVFLEEDEYFYKLRVPLRKGALPYDRLKNITCSIGEGLIFAKGTKVDESKVRVYRPGSFPKLMLFNSSVSMLKESIFDPAGTSVSLVDERGELAGEVHRLVPFASEIRIVTLRPGRYDAVAAKLMGDYGVSLLVTDSYRELSESTVVISQNPDCVPVSYKGIIFSGGERVLPFAKVLTGVGIKCDDKYKSLCPEGIDKLTFISALYELAFQRELHFAEYEKLVDICGLKS